MHSFLSKVFGRKKEDKDTSPTTLRPGELLDGKFEAVSPNVSPSAAHFLELDGQTNGENAKDKDKDVVFALFKAKSRPSPPEIRGKRPDTLPHLSLDFSAFNGDSNTNNSLTLEQTILSDAIIGRRRLNPMEALVLIRACSQSIVSKGLETLGVMHPHWYSASPEVQRRLISQFIHSMEPKTPPTAFSPNSAVASPFESEIELTHTPHDIAAVLRWGLRHFRLDGDTFGTDDGWYKAFLDAEAAAEYPPKAFTEKLAPLLPPAHLDVLVATLEVFSYLAAHSEANGTSGSKLSKIFGLWLLSARQVEDKDDWQSFYARWERTGRMLEHLFLSRIRDEFTDQRMPVRLLELVRRYPYTQGLSSPTTDLQLLPRPYFTTQSFDALFVRIDVELPPERRKPTSKSPSDILADAFSTKVEDGEYAELWGKITATSKDGGNPSPLSNIFADETIRFLSLIPDKNSGKAVEPKSPTFSLLPISPSSPRGRSFSAAEPDKLAPVQHPKSATEPPPASAVSALSIGSDWAQFSSSGFLDTNPAIAPLISTLFDTDVEKTLPPAAPLSRKSSKRRAASRKSVDLSAEPVKPVPEAETEVVKEEPKPVVRATNLQVIQIDEAFVDFWSDSLLDPITAAWPTFIICKFKSTLVPQLQYTAREDGIQKTLKWLVLEQVITAKPAPPPVLPASPSTSVAETARPVSPALSTSGRTRFSFWSMSRTASSSSQSSQKGKKKEKVLSVGEMGELLEEESPDQVKSAPSKVLTFSKSRKSTTEKPKDPTRKSVDVHAAKDVAPTSPVVAQVPAAEKAAVIETADSKDAPGVSIAVGAAATGAVAVTAAVAAAVESQPAASEVLKEDPNVESPSKDVQAPDVQEVEPETDVFDAQVAPAQTIEAPVAQTSVEPASVEAKEETEAAQTNEVGDTPIDNQISAAETVEAPAEPASEVAPVEAKEETEAVQISDVSPTPVDTQVAPVETVDAPPIETSTELPSSEIVSAEAKEEEIEAEVNATPVDTPVAPVEIVEAPAKEISEEPVPETAAVAEAKEETEAAQVPEVSAEPAVEQEGEAVVDTPIPTTEAPTAEPSEPALEISTAEKTDAVEVHAVHVDAAPVAESLVEETVVDTPVETIEAPAPEPSSAEPVSESVLDVETKEETEVTAVPETIAVAVTEPLGEETAVDTPVEAPATSADPVSEIAPVIEGHEEVETAQAPEVEAVPVAEPSGEESISVSEDHPIVASGPETVKETVIPATSSTEPEAVEDIADVADVPVAQEISSPGEAEAVVESTKEDVLPDEPVEEKSGGIAEEEIVSSTDPAAESLVKEESQELAVVEPATVEIDKDLPIDTQPENELATEVEQDQPSDVVAPVDEQSFEEQAIVAGEAVVVPQIQEDVVQTDETVLQDATPIEEHTENSVEPSIPSTEIEPQTVVEDEITDPNTATNELSLEEPIAVSETPIETQESEMESAAADHVQSLETAPEVDASQSAIAEDSNRVPEEHATEGKPSKTLHEPEVVSVDSPVAVEDVVQEPETVEHPVEIPDVSSREVTDDLLDTDAPQALAAIELTVESVELKESVEEEKTEEVKSEGPVEVSLQDEPTIVTEVSHSSEAVPLVDEAQTVEDSTVSETLTVVPPVAPVEEELFVEPTEKDVPPVNLNDAVEETQHEREESDDRHAVEQPDVDDIADSFAVDGQTPVGASSEPINIASSIPDVVPVAVSEESPAEALIDIPPVPLVEAPTEHVEGAHVTVLMKDEAPKEIEPVDTTLDTEVSQTHIIPTALILAGSTPGPQSSLNPPVVELDEGNISRSLNDSDVREDNIIVATKADEESANIVAVDQVNVTDEDPVINSVGSTSEQINLQEPVDDTTDASVAEPQQSIAQKANDDSALEGPPDETKLDDSLAEEIATVPVAAVVEDVLVTDQTDVTVPAAAAEEIKEEEILDPKSDVAAIPSVDHGLQGETIPDENVSSTIGPAEDAAQNIVNIVTEEQPIDVAQEEESSPDLVQADTLIADGTLSDKKPVLVDHPDPIPVLKNPIAVEDASAEDSSAALAVESLEEEKIENEQPLADQEGIIKESATKNLQDEKAPVLDRISNESTLLVAEVSEEPNVEDISKHYGDESVLSEPEQVPILATEITTSEKAIAESAEPELAVSEPTEPVETLSAEAEENVALQETLAPSEQIVSPKDSTDISVDQIAVETETSEVGESKEISQSADETTTPSQEPATNELDAEAAVMEAPHAEAVDFSEIRPTFDSFDKPDSLVDSVEASQQVFEEVKETEGGSSLLEKASETETVPQSSIVDEPDTSRDSVLPQEDSVSDMPEVPAVVQDSAPEQLKDLSTVEIPSEQVDQNLEEALAPVVPPLIEATLENQHDVIQEQSITTEAQEDEITEPAVTEDKPISSEILEPIDQPPTAEGSDAEAKVEEESEVVADDDTAQPETSNHSDGDTTEVTTLVSLEEPITQGPPTVAKPNDDVTAPEQDESTNGPATEPEETLPEVLPQDSSGEGFASASVEETNTINDSAQPMDDDAHPIKEIEPEPSVSREEPAIEEPVSLEGENNGSVEQPPSAPDDSPLKETSEGQTDPSEAPVVHEVAVDKRPPIEEQAPGQAAEQSTIETSAVEDSVPSSAEPLIGQVEDVQPEQAVAAGEFIDHSFKEEIPNNEDDVPGAEEFGSQQSPTEAAQESIVIGDMAPEPSNMVEDEITDEAHPSIESKAEDNFSESTAAPQVVEEPALPTAEEISIVSEFTEPVMPDVVHQDEETRDEPTDDLSGPTPEEPIAEPAFVEQTLSAVDDIPSVNDSDIKAVSSDLSVADVSETSVEPAHTGPLIEELTGMTNEHPENDQAINEGDEPSLEQVGIDASPIEHAEEVPEDSQISATVGDEESPSVIPSEMAIQEQTVSPEVTPEDPDLTEPVIAPVVEEPIIVEEVSTDDVPSTANSEVPLRQPLIDASPVELVDEQPPSSEAQDSEADLPEQPLAATEDPPLEETSSSSQTLADAQAEPDATEPSDILIPAVDATESSQNESSTVIEEPAQSLHSDVLPTDESSVSHELEEPTIEESPLESSAPVADEPANETSGVAGTAVIEGEPTTEEISVEESADSAEETVAPLNSTELNIAEAPISVEEPLVKDVSKNVDADPEQLQDDDAPPAAESEVSVESPSNDVPTAENVVAETIEHQPSIPEAEPLTEPTELVDTQEDAIVEQPILVDDLSAELPVQEQSSISEETTAIPAVPTPEPTILEEPVADEPPPIPADPVDSQEPLTELTKDISVEETTFEQPEPTPQEANGVSEELKAVDEAAEDPDAPVEHPEPISETINVADDKVVEEDEAIDGKVAADVVVSVDEESATGLAPTPEEPIQVEDKAGAEEPAATDTTVGVEGQDVAAEELAVEEPESTPDEGVVPQEVEAIEVAVAEDRTAPVEETKEDSIPVDDEVVEKEAEVMDEPAAVEEPGSAEEPINVVAEGANAIDAAPEEQVAVVEATTFEEPEPTQNSAPANDEAIPKEVDPADNDVVEDAADVPVESTTVEEPQPTPEPALVEDVPEETPASDTAVSDENHLEEATIDEPTVQELPSEEPESPPEELIPVRDEVVLEEDEIADQAVTAEDNLPDHTPTVEEPASPPEEHVVEDISEEPEVVADVSERPKAVEQEAVEEAVPASEDQELPVELEPIEESEPTPESVPVNNDAVSQDIVEETVAVENKDIAVEEPETIPQEVIPDDEVAPEGAKATETAQEGTEEPISVGDEVVLEEEIVDQAVAAEDDLPGHTPTVEEPVSTPEGVENASEDPQVVEDAVPVSDDQELPVEPESIEESEPTTESVPVNDEAVLQDTVEETVVVENKDIPVEETTVEEPETAPQEVIPGDAVAAEETKATEAAQEDTDVPVESAISEEPESTPEESNPIETDSVEAQTAEETVSAEVQDVEPQESVEEPESTQEPAPVEVVPEEPTAIDAPIAVEDQDVPVEETTVEVSEPTAEANGVDDAAIVEEGEVAGETVDVKDQDTPVEETKIEEPEATSAESIPVDAVAEEAAPEETKEVDAVVPDASPAEENVTEAAEPSQEQPAPVDDEVVLEPEVPEPTEATQDVDTPTEKTPLEQPEPVQENIVVDDEVVHEEAEAVDATLSVEELDEMLPSPSTDLSTVDPDASFATSGPFALESVMSSIGEELGDDNDEEDDPVLDVDSKVSEAEDDILNGTASGNGHLAESDVDLSEPVAEPSEIDSSLVEKAPEDSNVVEDATNGNVVDGPSISEDSPPDSEPVFVALDKENGEHIDKSVLSTLGPDEETEPSVVEIAGLKVSEVAADEVEA